LGEETSPATSVGLESGNSLVGISLARPIEAQQGPNAHIPPPRRGISLLFSFDKGDFFFENTGLFC
jgi:hypothetical protein